MNLIYAALMLHEADKDINEDNIEAMLDAVGIEVDSSQVKALTSALSEVDIEEAMEEAVSVGAPAPTEPSTSEEEEEAEEEVEEEEESEEQEEEEAAEGLNSLF